VTVVVVTYNSEQHIVELLHSLRAQTYPGCIDAILVDNASTDDTVALARREFAGVTVIPLPANVGYRRGNMLGMDAAVGDYILVCNDDIVLDPGCISALGDCLSSNPRAGIASPLILQSGETRVNTAGNRLAISGFYSARGKGANPRTFSNPARLASVSGCCFLYRRSLFQTLGGFSDDFELHPAAWHASYEDVDLSWRVRAAGYEIDHVPTSIVHHKYRQKQSLSEERFESMLFGRMLLIARQFQLSTIAVLSPYLATVEMSLIAYAVLRGGSFFRGYIRTWTCLLQNLPRLIEMRARQQRFRTIRDTEMFRLLDAVVEITPVLRRNPIYAAGYRFLALLSMFYWAALWPLRCLRYDFLKRALDISISASALIGMAPVFMLITLAIRFFQGSPTLFRQQRPGLNGVPFPLLKFRTMTVCDPGQPAPADETRITLFGAFLRKTSLDELPQLWNVLRGQMSLVGPRPLLPQYLSRYTPEQRRRHEVKPGITGWAQVCGRNELAWERKFALDNWYVDNRSFWLDCKILWLTIAAVIRRTGIRAEGHMTMPEFLGTSEIGLKQ
jgi:lipopolysaccharide/colanic/teichoic acid biosynthesis glycosyltransferase/GT2 family glycosyltransferase